MPPVPMVTKVVFATTGAGLTTSPRAKQMVAIKVINPILFIWFLLSLEVGRV
jgi:hypothetical protein